MRRNLATLLIMGLIIMVCIRYLNTSSSNPNQKQVSVMQYKTGEGLLPEITQAYKECSGYKMFNECSNEMCADNDYEQKIFTAWKKYFIAINGYTETYFNEHVTVTNIDSYFSTYYMADAVSVYYVVNYDWVRYRGSDSFTTDFVNFTDNQLQELAEKKKDFYYETHVRYKLQPINQNKMVVLLNKKYKNTKLTYDFCDIKESIYGYGHPPNNKDRCYSYTGGINVKTGKIGLGEGNVCIE